MSEYFRVVNNNGTKISLSDECIPYCFKRKVNLSTANTVYYSVRKLGETIFKNRKFIEQVIDIEDDEVPVITNDSNSSVDILTRLSLVTVNNDSSISQYKRKLYLCVTSPIGENFSNENISKVCIYIYKPYSQNDGSGFGLKIKNANNRVVFNSEDTLLLPLESKRVTLSCRGKGFDTTHVSSNCNYSFTPRTPLGILGVFIPFTSDCLEIPRTDLPFNEYFCEEIAWNFLRLSKTTLDNVFYSIKQYAFSDSGRRHSILFFNNTYNLRPRSINGETIQMSYPNGEEALKNNSIGGIHEENNGVRIYNDKRYNGYIITVGQEVYIGNSKGISAKPARVYYNNPKYSGNVYYIDKDANKIIIGDGSGKDIVIENWLGGDIMTQDDKMVGYVGGGTSITIGGVTYLGITYSLKNGVFVCSSSAKIYPRNATNIVIRNGIIKEIENQEIECVKRYSMNLFEVIKNE